MYRKEKVQVRNISEKIKKGIGDNKRSEMHEKVQNILEQFEGLKSIANMKTRKFFITH